MTVIIRGGGGRGKAKKYPFTATRVALVHKPSDNDDG